MVGLNETFKALSDPSRRRQLERLAGGVATSGQLAELLTMSRPAGSQHLAALIDAGLVRTRPAGRQRWHTLEPDLLYSARAWIDEVLTKWEAAEALAPTGPASSGEAPVGGPLRSSP